MHLLYKSYWIAFGLALGGIALLFWQRGVALSFRERLRIAKSRLSGKMAFALSAVFAGVVCFGGLLFQAENNPANTHLSAAQEQEHLERFQRDFGKYRETVQPRIVSVFFNLNLFPESQSFRTTGYYVLVNKTERDIKFVFSVLSAEYALLQEYYRDVDLRIYHHPQHTYCLPQMLAGLKAALDYNTAFFGEYQHQQAQIIEFPRSEGTYATTAANCIPISEIRFINDSRNPADGAVDIAFYVAAHELSHAWWGNQVVPADALGATMLTESIAEYITAKVYERQYGQKSALQFLEIQQNCYRAGRADAHEEELPLVLVGPDQSYIAYGKGALAFYRLSERIGEANLNAALRLFLKKKQVSRPALPHRTGSAGLPETRHAGFAPVPRPGLVRNDRAGRGEVARATTNTWSFDLFAAEPAQETRSYPPRRATASQKYSISTTSTCFVPAICLSLSATNTRAGKFFSTRCSEPSSRRRVW